MHKENSKAGDGFLITCDCVEDGSLEDGISRAVDWLKKVIMEKSKNMSGNDIKIECYVDDHEVKHYA